MEEKRRRLEEESSNNSDASDFIEKDLSQGSESEVTEETPSKPDNDEKRVTNESRQTSESNLKRRASATSLVKVKVRRTFLHGVHDIAFGESSYS